MSKNLAETEYNNLLFRQAKQLYQSDEAKPQDPFDI